MKTKNWNKLKVLGVITARGGSKGVLRKNVRLLIERPLICWTFDQIRELSCLDKVVVSTEDTEIKTISEQEGIEVVDRPEELARDDSSSESVVLQVLQYLENKRGDVYDIVVILEPTSPLRSPQTIEKCVKKLANNSEVNSVMTVKMSRDNIGEMTSDLFKPYRTGAPRRRQLREPFFIESSTVYCTRVKYLKEHSSVVADPWHAVVVEETEAIDINSEIDFIVAESILKMKKENE